MHADLFMDLVRRAEAYKTKHGGLAPQPELESRHLQRIRAGGIVGGVLTDCRMAGESAEPAHLEQFIETVRRELAGTNDRLIQVKTASDLDQAMKTGTFAAIVGYEGLGPTKGELTWIHRLYNEAALRVAVLTHNDDNQYGGGALGRQGRLSGPTALGLTEKGRQAVALMNQLGILIDMSHASKATRADILAASTKPVMLSHSSAKAVYDNGRNLEDQEMRAIAEAGGLIGCMTSPAALANQTDKINPTLEQYLNHLRHMINAAGIDHVGLGLHFCEYLYTPEEYPPVTGLEDATKSQNIIQALLSEGYAYTEVEKIAWKNFYRIFTSAVG